MEIQVKHRNTVSLFKYTIGVPNPASLPLNSYNSNTGKLFHCIHITIGVSNPASLPLVTFIICKMKIKSHHLHYPSCSKC